MWYPKKLGAQLGCSLSSQFDGYILWPSLACFITIAVGFWSELGFLPLFAVLIIYGVQRLRKIAFVFRPKDILFDSN